MSATRNTSATPKAPASHPDTRLRARRMGIDTYQEPVIYMRADCHICRAEGFEAQARVEVRLGARSIIATLHPVTGDLLAPGEAGLSEAAWRRLGAADGEELALAHPAPLDSLRYVRTKAYGHRLNANALQAVVADIVAGRYSDLHLSAFITACAGDRLDLEETAGLARAMIQAGERITWPMSPVVDKHCVGGLPGNRTTLIVVPIAVACGAVMPKTSSRAITSPAGTADTMEALAPVALDLAAMRRVVEREGGCIVWGGAVRLSPADDILIRVERPLDLDSQGQLVASILSKKAAAGAEHVLIDLPVGPTVKVRSAEAAASLAARLTTVGRALGLHVSVLQTDGSQPVGRGIGPALEARDALAVLRRAPSAPTDLRERALVLAGRVLEMAGCAPPGAGGALARAALDDGRAWRKFQAICEAQGGMREPQRAAHTHVIVASAAGRVMRIDNRRLARVAKLAGAPKAPSAGVDLHAPLGTLVAPGQPLFTVHAEAPGELAYALAHVGTESDIVRVGALQ